MLDLSPDPFSYLLTSDGASLLSLEGAFEPRLELGPFCLDLSLGRDGRYVRSALICDPCRKGHACLRTCCGHLQRPVYGVEGDTG